MRKFKDYNPISLTVWFIAAAIIPAVTKHPVFILIALFSSAVFYFLTLGRYRVKRFIYFALLFLLTALINPLISHKGSTVLFLINDSPITLESILFGLATASALVSVIFLFSVYSEIMTSEKLLYLLGKLSPRLALIISGAIRYTAILTKKADKIRDAERILGKRGDGSLYDNVGSGVRVLSATLGNALENGIITAESMEARGYGAVPRRTHFSLFKFKVGDLAFMLLSLVLFSLTISSIVFEKSYEYYPNLDKIGKNPLSVTGFLCYLVLAALPLIIKVKEAIAWKYYESRISRSSIPSAK